MVHVSCASAYSRRNAEKNHQSAKGGARKLTVESGVGETHRWSLVAVLTEPRSEVPKSTQCPTN